MPFSLYICNNCNFHRKYALGAVLYLDALFYFASFVGSVNQTSTPNTIFLLSTLRYSDLERFMISPDMISFKPVNDVISTNQT